MTFAQMLNKELNQDANQIVAKIQTKIAIKQIMKIELNKLIKECDGRS
jgi:recombinational DNA repair protein (RecF pathway)